MKFAYQAIEAKAVPKTTNHNQDKEMPEDYCQDGFNEGYDRSDLNQGHEIPESDGERYDYKQGVEDGERRSGYSYDDD